jgi:hypothetical protein
MVVKVLHDDFLIVVMHVEAMWSSHINAREDEHVPSLMAKHASIRIFLRKLHNLAIKQGVLQPLKPKM